MDLFYNSTLSKEDNLLKRFEEIHDYIYSNDGLSPQQTLEEFIKILFIKICAENKAQNHFSITATEWNELNAGQSIPVFIARISALFEETKQSYQSIFDANDRIKLSSLSLGFTINKLQSISFLNSSQDAKGLAFQKFLTHREKVVGRRTDGNCSAEWQF